ncbi:hypothetical protein PR202_gb13058 [Eleusine coracana subsp. coracana]|uniref:Protein kinase domain-containing protein n=1 Tax=Eleusine coracana subsp. coracana TaxID=191504 RepID=A0AAV5ERQ2_ELECO|nr:hypothetical protein PR202_gb13058 [Eleusine coracana subsp. coracana]
MKENMIICFEDVESGKCLREVPSESNQNKLNMRLIDFGSAIDDYTLKYLYDSGPTRSEQTFEYTPPEALLNSNWFQGSKNARLKLRSYMELCILVPGISSQHHGSVGPEQGRFGLASWKCSEESFAHQVKIRDPLKLGSAFLFLYTAFEDRLSVDEALNHPYFQEAP